MCSKIATKAHVAACGAERRQLIAALPMRCECPSADSGVAAGTADEYLSARLLVAAKHEPACDVRAAAKCAIDSPVSACSGMRCTKRVGCPHLRAAAIGASHDARFACVALVPCKIGAHDQHVAPGAEHWQ